MPIRCSFKKIEVMLNLKGKRHKNVCCKKESLAKFRAGFPLRINFANKWSRNENFLSYSASHLLRWYFYKSPYVMDQIFRDEVPKAAESIIILKK